MNFHLATLELFLMNLVFKESSSFQILRISILHDNSIRNCCGSLLSEKVVLTAAHCFYNEDHKKTNVSKVRVTILSSGRQLRALRLLVHPKYNDWNLDNDAALVVLPAVQVSPFLTKFTNNKCILFGQKSNHVSTNIDNLHECHRYLDAHNATYTDSMFCGAWHSVQHSCYGDSGCPIVCAEKRILGIVSFSTSCDSSAPVVFTNITKISDWLDKTLARI